MGLKQVIPAIFLIAVLVLVLSGFLQSYSGSKQFFKNLFIWSVIVVSIVIITYLIS
jgi:ABC-type multidrug transport system permease subunit